MTSSPNGPHGPDTTEPVLLADMMGPLLAEILRRVDRAKRHTPSRRSVDRPKITDMEEADRCAITR